MVLSSAGTDATTNGPFGAPPMPVLASHNGEASGAISGEKPSAYAQLASAQESATQSLDSPPTRPANTDPEQAVGPSIASEDLNKALQPAGVPVIRLDDVLVDPISFVEAHSKEGREFGAIKAVTTPKLWRQIRKWACIDDDTPCFAVLKQTVASKSDDIKSKLRFYNDLIKFHSDRRAQTTSTANGVHMNGVHMNGVATAENTVKLELGWSKSLESVISPGTLLSNSENLSGALTAPSLTSSEAGVVRKPEGVPETVPEAAIESETAKNEPTHANEETQIKEQTPTSQSPTPNLNAGAQEPLTKPEKQPTPTPNTYILATILGKTADENLTGLKLNIAGERHVNIYLLFKAVVLFGGFYQVQKDNSWKLVAKELGYKAGSVFSVTPTLVEVYEKLLLPFETHVSSSTPKINSEGKRLREDEHVLSILGSSKEYKRSVRSKLSKGFVPNFLTQVDIKATVRLLASPQVADEQVTPTSDEKKLKRKPKDTDVPHYIISPQAQLNHVIQNTLRNQLHIDDASLSGNNGFSVMSFRQIETRDEHFRAALLKENRLSSLESLDEIYWRYLSGSKPPDISEPLSGTHSESIVGSVFARVGDALLRKKAKISKSQETPPETEDMDFVEHSLHPWNLNNLAVAPNSLLASLSENDVCSDSLTSSSISVSSTFSTSNWTCEDHFTQQIDLLYNGGPKRWFFIPELEFHKFEQLLDTLGNATIDHSKYFSEWSSPDTNELNFSQMEYEVLTDALADSMDTNEDARLLHSNETFQKLIDYRKTKLPSPGIRDIVITPKILDKHNIKYYTTVQYPGEFIIKYPKTYSFNYSYGPNVSQQTNFASPLWLDYAVESEAWLKHRNIIPNFSVFKLMINLIQIYDAGQTSKIHFNSDVYRKIADIYKELLEHELELRTEVRLQMAHLKELILDDKVFSVIDAISDDSLSNAYPSKIVLTHTTTKKSFVVSLPDYLEYIKSNWSDEKATNKSIPIVRSSEMKVELQLYYSDEKLRTFYRSVVNYVSNYSAWMKEYEVLMSETDELPLKTYKGLLSEGEKVFSAISSPYYLEAFEGSGTIVNKEEVATIHQFKACIVNLRLFIDYANWYIDECQNILAIKHQQRIRNNDESPSTNDEDLLPRLLKVLGMIPTLNFSCSETEQILEFKNEIENFDVACRTFVTKPKQTMQEINDLINLGKSFGINLKSLEYIIRMKDRLKWIENFEIIIKGGDPFNDRKHKKQVFSLADLEEFYELGLKNLGKEDIHRIEVIDSMIRNSYMYDNRIIGFLEAEDVDSIKIEDVDKLIDEIESKFKLKGDKRIFINLEKLDDLYDFRSGLETLWKFFDFRDRVRKRSNFDTFNYHDIKLLKNELAEAKLPIKEAHHKFIANQLKKTTNFLKQCENLFNERLISTVLYSEIFDLRVDHDKKLTISESLMTTLQRLIQKCETSFAIDSDSYTRSSSYQEMHADDEKMEEDSYIQTYCVCREGERGTMIECETCKEWYHADCVEPKDKVEVDKGHVKATATQENRTKTKVKKEPKASKASAKKSETSKENDVKQEENSEQSTIPPDQPELERKENTVKTDETKIKAATQAKPDDVVQKVDGIKEDGDDAYLCPMCELVHADVFIDSYLTKAVTQLRLISLMEEGRKLTVYPPNEWSKLKELNDLVSLSSQHLMVEVERIKQSTDTTSVKNDKLRFLLRKVYGAGIFLEDFYYELMTTVKKLVIIERIEKGLPVPMYFPVVPESGPSSASPYPQDVDREDTPLPPLSVDHYRHESPDTYTYAFRRKEPSRLHVIESSATPYLQTEDALSIDSKVSTPSHDVLRVPLPEFSLSSTRVHQPLLEGLNHTGPAVSPIDSSQPKNSLTGVNLVEKSTQHKTEFDVENAAHETTMFGSQHAPVNTTSGFQLEQKHSGPEFPREPVISESTDEPKVPTLRKEDISEEQVNLTLVSEQEQGLTDTPREQKVLDTQTEQITPDVPQRQESPQRLPVLVNTQTTEFSMQHNAPEQVPREAFATALAKGELIQPKEQETEGY